MFTESILVNLFEQRMNTALDEAMCAMNFCSSEYGRSAYKQGFEDAIPKHEFSTYCRKYQQGPVWGGKGWITFTVPFERED